MIVAGFGFRAGANAASLADALARTGGTPDRLATLSDKAETAVFQDFVSDRPRVAVVPVAPEDARAAETPTRSTASLDARGTGSVAEACALVAAGPGARIIVPRVVSGDRMATCALAQTAPTGEDR